MKSMVASQYRFQTRVGTWPSTRLVRQCVAPFGGNSLGTYVRSAAIDQTEQRASFFSVLAELKPGDSFHPPDVGRKYMPRWVRKCLFERGLIYCNLTKRIHYPQAMYSERCSFEGLKRWALYKNAWTRAKSKGLRFDKDMMLEVAFGPLPLAFNGVPYLLPCGQRRGPGKWSLTLDRISNDSGYVRGNVRFLPFWLNTSLQHFSDMKVYRITERLMGLRPLIRVAPMIAEEHATAKTRVKKIRSTSRQNVESCFTFDNLLQIGAFVDRCQYSGIRLLHSTMGTSGGQFNSPSFDRIDPHGKYSIGNVQVVARAVNSLKSDIKISEMQRLLDAVDHLRSEAFLKTHVRA